MTDKELKLNSELNRIAETFNVDYLQPHLGLSFLSKWIIPRLVGDGFCVSPKLTISNDEVGWFCSYSPNAPSAQDEITIVGDTLNEAIGQIAVKVLGGQHG